MKYFTDNFPDNHEELLKKDPYYPYTAEVRRKWKTIRFNLAREIDGDKSFSLRIPTVYALLMEKAHEEVTARLDAYCTENRLSLNSPARHKRLMELEHAFYKPIHDKFRNEVDL